MIASVDVETQGLDCTKYVVGCVTYERNNKEYQEIYHEKQDLWNRIIQLGLSEAKRGKTLSVYSHNATYDFYSYADLKSKKLKWFCHKPFIVKYQHNGKETNYQTKEVIAFLDTMSLYPKQALKNVGNLIGMEKGETPAELIQGKNIRKDSQKMREVIQYLKRDCKITLEAVKKMKQQIREDGLNIKRLYTINQVAINYTMQKIKQQPIQFTQPLFWNYERGEMARTFRTEEIHAAYRTGKVEAYQTGQVEEVTAIDCNSLFPYGAATMRMPNLHTERKTWKPLEKTSTQELLNQIGVSRCMLKNKTANNGVLMVRTPTGNYTPKPKQNLIGTWTHEELQYALKTGYELIDIEWSVTWQDAPNALTAVMNQTYNKRMQAQNKHANYFYKMMMNAAIGKMAQRKAGQEIVIDDVSKAQEYLARNWKIVKGIDLTYMYQNQNTQVRPKPYYAPAIPCMITAKARVHMAQQWNKIPKKDRVYTDTDSIFHTGKHLKKFAISNKMGDFKIQHQNEPMMIYGRKTYSIGPHLRVAGTSTKALTNEDFKKGIITSQKIVGIKQAPTIEQVGKFTKETRNLKQERQNHKQIKSKYEAEPTMIDSDITNANHFIQHLK